MKTKIWKLYSLDVWGNAKEGYEVNDRYHLDNLELSDNATEKELVKILKSMDYLKKTVKMKQLKIDWDEDYTTIDSAKTGKPLFQLIKEF
jgi:hypothetical protein